MAVKHCTHDGPRGTGDGSSVANAWSFDNALASLTNADVLYMHNTGTYALTGATRAFTNAGTESLPMNIIGVSADGTVEDSVTISGDSMDASSDILYPNATSILSFRNIRLTAARRHGINQGGTGSINIRLFNCRIDSCLGSGFYSQNSGGQIWMSRCRLDSNATGLSVTGTVRGRVSAFDCVFANNTSHGVYDSTSGSASQSRPAYNRCIFLRNGGDGLRFYTSTTAGGIHVYNNTFFANTGDGLNVLGSHGQICINHNIFRSNGAYGIRLNSSTIDQLVDCVGNCSHNNTSGYIDINSGVLPGSGHVLENPAFLSETDGSEDLTPTNLNLRKSYAYQKGGTSYFWPGAIQPQAAAGGRPEMRAAR